MRCPHCAREVLAERTGDGVLLSYGPARRFVVTARCPHPSCAELVAASTITKLDPHSSYGATLDALTTTHAVLSWSPTTILRSATDWSWPCALLLGFGVVPLWGASEASRSVRCGGLGWVFFVAGTFLALVPVICFSRAVLGVAIDAVRGALSARNDVRSGAAGGLRLVPEAANYRGIG